MCADQLKQKKRQMSQIAESNFHATTINTWDFTFSPSWEAKKSTVVIAFLAFSSVSNTTMHPMRPEGLVRISPVAGGTSDACNKF